MSSCVFFPLSTLCNVPQPALLTLGSQALETPRSPSSPGLRLEFSGQCLQGCPPLAGHGLGRGFVHPCPGLGRASGFLYSVTHGPGEMILQGAAKGTHMPPLCPACWSAQSQFSGVKMGPPRSSCATPRPPSRIRIAPVSQVPSPCQARCKCFTSIILTSPTPGEVGYCHPRFVGEETKAQRSDLPTVTQLVSSRDWAFPPHHAASPFAHLSPRELTL